MARQLKYSSHDVDLDRLRAELGGGDDPARDDGDVAAEVTDER